MATFINFPEIDVKIEGLDLIKLPKMVKIRQIYNHDRIEDLKVHTENQLDTVLTDHHQFAGKKICITAGSRGIPNLDLIIRTIIDTLKSWGADPFIVPAMGSHGGATAEGQKDYLASFHITEETMGVPILSSMDVVQLGQLEDGTPVYCDRIAYESDGIVVLNKIKPHTDFRGKHESGLAKMMAIGLANHKGAALFHMKGFNTFAERIPQVCNVFLEKAPIAFGVALIQNAYDEISELEVIPPESILQRDAELLEVAKSRIANFKTKDLDVLVIDEIGKNISGNGQDPNVSGRNNMHNFHDILNLKRMVVLGLTEETHHNGCGLGAADITTRKCLNSVDFESTWINCYNANVPNGGCIPMYTNTDFEAIRNAIRTCTGIDYSKVRLAHIRNTLCMEEIEVSETVYEELKDRPDVEYLEGPYELSFDEENNLMSNL